MIVEVIILVMVVTAVGCISIVTNHINKRLTKLENKLISIDNNIKYTQYLINTQDIDNNDKDIKVVIYSNGKEVYKYEE